MNTVQSAEKADSSAIDHIMCSLSIFSVTDRDCVRELWGDYLDNYPQSTYQFCTCRDFISQNTLGFACFGKHALTETTFDLYWIAVDPANQRTGAGSDLLAYVEQQVIRQQGRRLVIETSSTDAFASARKFYRRHHYQREAMIRDFYAPGDDLVIFTKNLVPPRGPVIESGQQDSFNRQPGIFSLRGPRRSRFPG
jgi:ribosomal protein S18 acetylase RimI-like enzyme